MIFAVRCNMPSFKEVRFEPGFNVVLADRTKESTKRDSRNGLGKTTLIEIIHYCLGARAPSNRGLRIASLKGWSFTLEMQINDRQLAVTRSTDHPRWIQLDGDVRDLSSVGERMEGFFTLDVNIWTSLLGDLFFGLNTEHSGKYRPSFRSLFSYFARRGRDAFASPFVHNRSQQEWDKQINNAYLLGLSWEHASQLRELKDEENALNGLRRAVQAGLLQGMIGTLGNLEAERARLELEVQQHSKALNDFRVHPQYEEIELEVNQLTSAIQKLMNSNIVDGRLADLYRNSLEEDQVPDSAEFLEVYREVGFAMPALVRHRLEEVEEFHKQLLTNRQAYLESEIQSIETKRTRRKLQISARIERRAKLLEVLRTHGALHEFTRLQELHLDVISRRNDIDNQIANLRRFEQGRSEVRVKRELLLQDARREFEERRYAREEAINIFNSKSEELYSAPGNLVVDIVNNGFRFDVEILRSGSQGIDNMKIFCYDHLLAQLWSHKKPYPGFLIHDSTIFDGVDERQVANAIELGQRESETNGYQYVCALNSDTLPYDDFSPGFDLNRYVRIRFTDASEEGGLLGIRY